MSRGWPLPRQLISRSGRKVRGQGHRQVRGEMQRWELEEVLFLSLLFLDALGSKVLAKTAGGTGGVGGLQGKKDSSRRAGEPMGL